jgi:hypothetical protein
MLDERFQYLCREYVNSLNDIALADLLIKVISPEEIEKFLTEKEQGENI